MSKEMPLWSDDKNTDAVESLDVDEVIYNLFEDVGCLKENLEKLRAENQRLREALPFEIQRIAQKLNSEFFRDYQNGHINDSDFQQWCRVYGAIVREAKQLLEDES